ncbi:MAG: hypothetical protein KAH38_01125 [Candidatus Hydrogenedentes bacterium]|nr:hypothetical protein [Candidatus Hydrogenedentota bacterium]
MADKHAFKIIVSAECLDIMHLGDEVEALDGRKVAELLFPIGDGNIAPFTMGFNGIRQICARTTVPCHVLLLARQPERHIDACAAAGCTTMTISYEAATHSHRILTAVRDAGMKAGIAVNPGTSLVELDYLIEKADHVCLLGVEPGSSLGEKANPAIVERVKLLLENIRYRELWTQIMIYGGIDMAIAGQVRVAGASSIGIEPRMLLEMGEADRADALKKYIAMLQTQ